MTSAASAIASGRARGRRRRHFRHRSERLRLPTPRRGRTSDAAGDRRPVRRPMSIGPRARRGASREDIAQAHRTPVRGHPLAGPKAASGVRRGHRCRRERPRRPAGAPLRRPPAWRLPAPGPCIPTVPPTQAGARISGPHRAECQVEVEEHRRAVRRDQDVGRLEIKVQQPAIVGVLQCIGEARADPADNFGRGGPFEEAGGRSASGGGRCRRRGFGPACGGQQVFSRKRSTAIGRFGEQVGQGRAAEIRQAQSVQARLRESRATE